MSASRCQVHYFHIRSFLPYKFITSIYKLAKVQCVFLQLLYSRPNIMILFHRLFLDQWGCTSQGCVAPSSACGPHMCSCTVLNALSTGCVSALVAEATLKIERNRPQHVVGGHGGRGGLQGYAGAQKERKRPEEREGKGEKRKLEESKGTAQGGKQD